jgi:RNA polymerase sigma-70 factor (ECF subfamily)
MQRLEHLQAEDVELAAIRLQFRAEFKKAFEVAFRALPARSRTLLRLQLVDGLPVEEIGRFYGATRSSASRWLIAAREELGSETKRALKEQLKVQSGDIASLMRAVDSQLGASLLELVREAPLDTAEP